MNGLLFELKGPHYELAAAEVEGALQGLQVNYRVLDYQPGVLHVETSLEPKEIGRRLGLTHCVYTHLATADEDELIRGESGITIPPGSVAVSTRRIGGRKANTQKINIGLGKEISLKNPIDLDDPLHRVVVLVSDKCFVGLMGYNIENAPFHRRLVQERPFFSPISLEPKFARALLNLARVDGCATIHDPFCGTGGILLEAADMELSITGGDIDKRMVEGSKVNLDVYGYNVPVFQGDVLETTPRDLDCIVTDPPYGRSSSSQGEDVHDIYLRLFETARDRLKKEGYLSTIFPDKKYFKIGEKYLVPLEIYDVRVHRSLYRYFCVFKKE